MHHSDAPKDEEPSPKDPAEAVAAPCTHKKIFLHARTSPQNMPVCPGINALRGRTQLEGTPACLRYFIGCASYCWLCWLASAGLAASEVPPSELSAAAPCGEADTC